ARGGSGSGDLPGMRVALAARVVGRMGAGCQTGVMRQRIRPEEIIGEWGVRDVTPPSQAERAKLAAEHELNPLVGQPLRRRLRNFRADPYGYIASLGGPL